MRVKVIALFVVCLVCVISSEAKDKIQIVESKTEAKFVGNKLDTNIVFESTKAFDSANIHLKVLDYDDDLLAQARLQISFKRGKQTLSIPIDFGKQYVDNLLLWSRLEYEITSKDSQTLTKGIIAMSEILPEIFDLNVIASEGLYPGVKYRVYVLTLHPSTKQPIENVNVGATVSFELADDEKETEMEIKASGRSNSKGVATLDFEIPADVKLRGDGYGDYDIVVIAEKNGVLRVAEEDYEIPKQVFFYMHTDKPIYQPSQKLFVRGLLFNPLKKPVKDNELTIEITDDDEEVIHSEEVKTSRFGVAHLEWQIPENIKLGKYKIRIEDDDDDEFGNVEFKITRYELPNFAVKASPDKSYYQPKEKKATIKVSADYLFGKPVTKGKVRIVRESDSKEIQANKLDDEGNFSAEFDLQVDHDDLEAEEWKYFNDLKFTAYFTDLTTNRTEQKRFDLRLTKEPIHVYLIRSDTSANPSIPYQFYVSTFYADGTPVKTNVTIEGNYKDKNYLEKLAENRTNSYGATKFEINVPQKPFEKAAERFNLKITAVDKDGNEGILSENLYVNEDSEKIHIQTDKTIYKPNERIYVEVFSTNDKDTAIVDVVNETGVIYSKRVKISKGIGKVAINFRPDFEGELTLSAYPLSVFDRYDFPYHSKTIIFPEPNKLDFNVKSLKSVYRPNEEATMSFKVRDEKGSGQETALGIIVLDKAIEERAATENTPDNYLGIRKLLGAGNSFGNLKRRDLDNLDLEKRISKDLQLAAEYLLVNRSYKPKGFRSDDYEGGFKKLYADYYAEKLKPVLEVLNLHYEETGEAATDEKSLRRILSENKFDIDSLKDAWGEQFKFEFTPQRRKILLQIKTASADKEFGTADDFVAGQARFERFNVLTNKLNVILNNYINQNKETPKTTEELKQIWQKSGFDISTLKDEQGNPFYFERIKYDRDIRKVGFEIIGNLDGENQKVEKIQTVRQTIILFKMRSAGEDGIKNLKGDYDIGLFSVVQSEQIIKDSENNSKISKLPTKNSSGAIGGTVIDPTGAVIPGADVTATNKDSNEIYEATTNDKGYFLLKNLPSGIYEVSATSMGFQKTNIYNIVVSSMNLIELSINLRVAHISATVDVASDDVMLVDQTTSELSNTYVSERIDSIANIIGSGNQKFTPRVREYFPETLVWKPEIITDKKGRAEIKFRLADSLTTWKLYAIGSTENGEIEMFEKELQTFQPFFAELDPPKVLTEGDEISLPVPVRNYTKKRQKVSVEMAENNWSSLLNGTTQQIKISPASSENAIFKFRAVSPIENGKQKVTAVANKTGDAIEKSVRVIPNGKEESIPQTRFFNKETTFDLNFPAGAFPNTRKAEVKIYPNMLSHVAESIEGLLKRPYGCGEQTTSSTYPNLMILKFAKQNNDQIDPELKQKAQDYLQDGYQRLLNYQTDTGFGYWNGNKPDLALTAYVLQFLNDAKEFIEVDKAVVEKAELWLLSKQTSLGSWNKNNTELVTTAYVARTLSRSAEKDENKRETVKRAVDYLKENLNETNDSYVLANLALAAIEIKDYDTGNQVIAKLTADRILPVEANKTAFYGWGKTAQIETNAILIQALLKAEKRDEELISKGLQYLLKNKDKYGVWYSTQTTVNVLNTLILFQKIQKFEAQNSTNKATVFVNGIQIKELEIDNDGLKNPFVLDISKHLNQTNKVEIKNFDSFAMAQIVSTFYINWNQAKQDSKYFDLNVAYDKTKTEISEKITCTVNLKRKRGGYGMILAEIGIPPGADVDRAALDKIVNEDKISRYDVLPDKVLVYAWAGFELINFDFSFRIRYGINAQTSASNVYDYYNAEAFAVVSPTRFEIN